MELDGFLTNETIVTGLHRNVKFNTLFSAAYGNVKK